MIHMACAIYRPVILRAVLSWYTGYRSSKSLLYKQRDQRHVSNWIAHDGLRRVDDAGRIRRAR
jgi:hypothetical protein